ncbi:Ig-like domain-containing protein, partial [Gilvimarinus chinensis]|uniref:Ig-like domain-containing protein n=1 Tax=Gilvimarinus chinensis TaxID=396005 RepID=UPI000477137F
MANQSASVISLQGRAWAKDSEGNLRELKVGDVLAADEQLVSEANTQIVLDFGGETASLTGAHTVSMSPDLWPETAALESQASLLESQFESILASLDNNDEMLQQHQFNDIYASLDVNDELLGATPFEVILSALEVNEDLLQDNQFADIYSSLAANEALLKDSDFSTIYNYLAENDALLLDARVDDLLASLQANEQALLAGDGDLLDQLGEAPAAGSAGSEGGNSFVRLSRINESVADPNLSVFSARAGQSQTSPESDVRANEAPEIAAQSFSTSEDTPLEGQIDVADPENDGLTFVLIGAPANGQVQIDPQTGDFVYSPAENFNGDDSFTVQVSDGQQSTTEVIAVQVQPVNDAPQSNDETLTTPEDTPVSGQVEATDIDLPEGDALVFSLTTPPENGVVSLDESTGEYTYTPAGNYSGEDSFVVTVTDSAGATSTSVIDVTVTPVNDSPEAVDDSVATTANTTSTGNALDNDFDTDSESLSVSTFSISGDATVYTAGDTVAIDGVGQFQLLADGSFSFTPLTGFGGSIPEVTYTATDGELTDTAVIRFADIPAPGQPGGPALPVANITLDTVTADNLIDGSEANQDIALSGSVSGDAKEGDVVSLVIGGNSYSTVVTGNGTFSVVVPGSLLAANNSVSASVAGQDPAGNNYSASTVVNYEVDLSGPSINIIDGNGSEVGEQFSQEASAESVSGEVVVSATSGISQITVNGVSIISSNPQTPILIEGDFGSLYIDGYDVNTGQITYTYTENGNAENHSNGDQSVIDQFTFSVTDNANTTTTDVLDILIGDTEPEAVADSFAATEDQVFYGNVSTNDTQSSDGNTYSVEEGGGPSFGTVNMNADGTFDYTPDANYNGNDSFTYTVVDGDGDVRTSIVEIAVASVNDEPVAVADSASTAEDTVLTSSVDLDANDTDLDGDSLSVVAGTFTTSEGGTIVIASDGSYTYTPAANFTGTDTVDYTVTDG